LSGFNNTPSRDNCGTAALSNSSHFAPRSAAVSVRPVKFPPGLAKLAANPSITGSVVTVTIMGMLVVANRNALYTGLPVATMASTFD
jgi:hypothetical protein